MNRRTMLCAVSAAGATLMLDGAAGRSSTAGPVAALPSVEDPRFRSPIADASALPRFVNELPRPARIDLSEGGTVTLRMAPTVQDVIGGGLGLVTPVWGFGLDGPSFPGPTIVARERRSVMVDWVNDLLFEHLLPVDTTVHWAFGETGFTIAEQGVPTVVHLHGGHSESVSDGHPDAWYTTTGVTGPRYAGTRYLYDNSQQAATLWYHDHTPGLARLNVYAGLAGFYLLRDAAELELIARNALPSGPYEREVVIQDREFRPDGRLAYPDVPATAPTWPGGPSLPPQFVGRVIVVNGAAWPVLRAEPRQYRLRLLNASNARHYRLSVHGSWPFPMVQIGTDGGFLHRPVPLHGPLRLAPGERVDLVADFGDSAGQVFDLTNDGATPCPTGPAASPPADAVLRFRVDLPRDASVPEPRLPGTLRPTPYRVTGPATRTRGLLLFENADEYGRMRRVLGTVEQGWLAWSDPVTETPELDSTEIWEIHNTTAEGHPIHVHLVQFEVLDRASFTADQDPVSGALTNIVTGPPRTPEEAERGPKDTVWVGPGQVVRVLVRFDRPGGFVWHCHMLEHEDHAMMRNYHVQ